MPNIILRQKVTKKPEKKPPSIEDSYKAEVRLKLLKTRLQAVAALMEPVSLQDLIGNNGNPPKTVEEALANQVFKNEFAATLGHRLGDKVRVTDQANDAWKSMLMTLKIAERKYGEDHPWTQVVFEAVCNVAKKRAYYSIKSEDTQVEIAKMPLDMMMPQWRRRSTNLAR